MCGNPTKMIMTRISDDQISNDSLEIRPPSSHGLLLSQRADNPYSCLALKLEMGAGSRSTKYLSGIPDDIIVLEDRVANEILANAFSAFEAFLIEKMAIRCLDKNPVTNAWKAITKVLWFNQLVTVTSFSHGLVTGDRIRINGVHTSRENVNKVFQVERVSNDEFLLVGYPEDAHFTYEWGGRWRYHRYVALPITRATLGNPVHRKRGNSLRAPVGRSPNR